MKLVREFNGASKAVVKTEDKQEVVLKQHLIETNQTELLQSKILVEALEELTKRDLAEEAYLRGSLGRGCAHEDSDIDLFVVCEPNNIEETYNTIVEYMNKNGQVIVGCNDRIITTDYGGIGFTFLAQHDEQDKLYQFDLYIAMKYFGPEEGMVLRPRIYSKNNNYSWLEEYKYREDDVVVSDKPEEFISKHTQGNNAEDRIELILQEQMLNIVTAKKHIKQGQTSRLANDNKAIVTSAVEMLQELTGYKISYYSADTLGNEVVDFAKKNGDAEMQLAAIKLNDLFNKEITLDKLGEVFDYSCYVFSKAFPERYDKHEEVVDIFNEKVLERGVSVNDNKYNSNKYISKLVIG